MNIVLHNLCILLLLNFIISTLSSPSPICTNVVDGEKIACAAEKPTDMNVCLQRGCCWSKTNNTGPPSCYFPKTYNGYKVSKLKHKSHTVVVELERQLPSGLPNDVKEVLLEATYLNDRSLRLRFLDKNQKRFEIPFPKLHHPSRDSSERVYDLDVDPSGQLTVKRKTTGRVVFSTDLTKLIYSDQFLQLMSNIPSNYVYGLGENVAPLKKLTNWQRYELFNHDHPPATNMNLYGTHPFYLSVEDDDGNSNGVLLFNSNAMDVTLQPAPGITWRTIGGILDFYVFLGSSPNQVVNDYINLIGKPTMPPMWGLGFHLCRCCPSPKTLDDQKKITQRMIDAKIPFDVQWNAKEYMYKLNDFTLDNTTYGGLPEFVKHLHSIGMHYVQIKEPGMSGGETPGTYAPYDDGVKMGVFIKNSTGKILIGHAWNLSGKTVYVDFSNPKSIEYYTKQWKDYHKLVPLDGAWNDMNEISNIEGNKGSIYGCPNTTYDNPPYAPEGHSLISNTICQSARQYAGIQYNVHNLYATYQALATNIALRKTRGKRPFIISRASFVGHGRYAGHWDGDIYSTYDQMKWTITSIMNMNMFGIPLIGADICGFQGNVKNDSHFIELCARWHELGAFYPFSRNHNVKSIDQDPVALGPIVVNSAKNALNIRYSLLPYLYTLFYQAERHGTTVARPVFFEFPKDKNSYDAVTQFMWGAHIMIMPVVNQGERKVNAYFPKGKWYLYDIDKELKTVTSQGNNITLDAPMGKINVAIREGSIIPTQPPKTTTTHTRKQNFTILVILNDDNFAQGQLYWDDGDSIDPLIHNKYTLVNFYARNNQVHFHPEHVRYHDNMPVGDVRITNFSEKPTEVKVNGANVPVVYSNNTLYLRQLNLDLKQDVKIEWIF